MPNKPGNEERGFAGGDRERAREVSNESDRGKPSGVRQRSARGFASMDRSKQREIASKGGKAAHAKGTAHEFDSGEARDAGRKGGQAVSRNREHMAAIGRRGGEARGHARGRGASKASAQGAGGSEEGAVRNPRSADREVDLPRNANAVPSSESGGTHAAGSHGHHPSSGSMGAAPQGRPNADEPNRDR